MTESTPRPTTARRRGMSIGTLCAVVAVAAVDFGWWKHVIERWGGAGSLFGFKDQSLDAAVMPMASVLVVGFVHSLGNRGDLPRWFLGFMVGGLTGLAIYFGYCYACWLLPQGLVRWSRAPMYAARVRWRWHDSNPFSNYFYNAAIAYFGPPQFALACLGALIAGKQKSRPDLMPAEITSSSEKNP